MSRFHGIFLIVHRVKIGYVAVIMSLHQYRILRKSSLPHYVINHGSYTAVTGMFLCRHNKDWNIYCWAGNCISVDIGSRHVALFLTFSFDKKLQVIKDHLTRKSEVALFTVFGINLTNVKTGPRLLKEA